MAYALVIAKSSASLSALKDFLEQRGTRVKAHFDPAKGCLWLEEQKADVVLVGEGVTAAECERLLASLCRKNPFAPLIVYDPQALIRDRERRELLLMGAQLLQGKKAQKALEVAMFGISGAPKTVNEKYGVLIVDDLEPAQFIIAELVRSIGYPHVATFRDVDSALRELKHNPKRYYCIITDLKMPKKDGTVLIREVRADRQLQHIPIVVLTAYGSGEALLECLKAGATFFMLKPPKGADLKREISRSITLVLGSRDPWLVDPDNQGQVAHLAQLLEKKGLI